MEYLKVKDFADVITGGTPSTTVAEYWENGTIPWIQSGSCKDGIINNADKYITEKGLNNSSAKIMPKDTVVIALTGATAGKIGILNIETSANQSVTGILPNDKCRPMYLFNYLISIRNKILSDCYGGAQKHISQGYVKEMLIPVPELSLQDKIISRISKISTMIKIKNKQLKRLDELVKSQFVEMFKNCEIVKLHEIADITMGQSPSSSSYNNSGDGIPFFQGKADYGDKFTIVRHWTNQPTKLAYKNDVLMSVRAPVGPVNISSCDCCIGRGLCAITSKLGLTNNEFLYNALNTIQDDLSSKGTGSTFKAITKDDVYNIDLPLAPIELQNKFAEFVKQIDKQKFEFEKQLKKLEELQASLMQEYFG